MNDKEYYDRLAADLWNEHAPDPHKMMAGPFGAGGLAAIIQWLRANGATIGEIIKKIVPIILAIINGGGNWTAIVAAIWALLFPDTPLPPLPAQPA